MSIRIQNSSAPFTNIVTFVNGTTNFSTSSLTSATLTYSPTAGNIVMVVIAGSSPPGQMVCKDNNNNVLPLIQNMTQAGNPTGGAQFCGVAISGATSYTVTWSGGSFWSAALGEWSGVSATGAFSKTEGTTATSWTNSQSLTGTGNLIVTGFGFFSSNTLSTTVTTGTEREFTGANGTDDFAAIIDNNNTSGVTAAGVIAATPESWSCASVELIASVISAGSNAVSIG